MSKVFFCPAGLFFLEVCGGLVQQKQTSLFFKQESPLARAMEECNPINATFAQSQHKQKKQEFCQRPRHGSGT
jgi:hypothetical protein